MKKRKLLIAALLILMAFAAGSILFFLTGGPAPEEAYAPEAPPQEVSPPAPAPSPAQDVIAHHTITASDVMLRIERGDAHVLLDVRTESEFLERHIPGALLIPVEELMLRAESELLDKDMPIFVYCRSGRRSADAAGMLASLGYTQVYDFGGILDWPYETVMG